MRSGTSDPDVYARFVERSGGPALELGCGDGHPMLDLVRRGLDVDGVDASADMVDRCRANAAAEALDVTVYHQRFQDLDLPRRYRSIYVADASFTLLPTDDDAIAALDRIRAHLADDGTAMIPLMVPEATPTHDLGRSKEAIDPTGAVIRVTPVSEERDEHARTQVTVLRYERIGPAGHESEDRPWVRHWYGQDDFRALVDRTGLRTIAVFDPAGGPARPDATAFVVLLGRGDPN